MSRYSGKCDFCDTIEIHGVENIMNSIIYVGDKKLEIKDPKEFIPYYPYIVAMMSWEKDHGTIWLSKESYVDIEEREHLEYELKDVLRVYNRCKRKKVEFTYEEVKKYLPWTDDEIVEELYKRVKENGKKATIEGIHTRLFDYYRENLKEEMERNGLHF